MDELVKNLMEELNCDTAFTIPIFGGIPVAESVFVTWLIMAVVILLCGGTAICSYYDTISYIG